MYIYLFKYAYILKYNSLRPYDVTGLHFLRAEPLALDTQSLVCPFLERTPLLLSVVCSCLCKAEVSWVLPCAVWNVH